MQIHLPLTQEEIDFHLLFSHVYVPTRAFHASSKDKLAQVVDLSLSPTSRAVALHLAFNWALCNKAWDGEKVLIMDWANLCCSIQANVRAELLPPKFHRLYASLQLWAQALKAYPVYRTIEYT